MEHFYENIRGWFDPDFERVYREAVERAPSDRGSIFVEVGAFRGKSTAFMAVEIIRSGKPIKFYTVDHWMGSSEHRDPDCSTYDVEVAETLDLWPAFVENLLPVLHVVHPISIDSAVAGIQWRSEVDFVFIDASHDESSVLRDIDVWKRTLKEDGVMAGHDIAWASVFRSVSSALTGWDRVGSCWVWNKTKAPVVGGV